MEKIADNKRVDVNDGFWRVVSSLPEHKDIMPHIEQAMILQAQNGNKIAYTEIVENYMRPTLALAIGVYLANDWDCKISTEDTIAEGWKALSESVMKWNVNSGKSFWQFARCYIFKAFRLARRFGQMIPVSEWQARMSAAATEAYDKIYDQTGIQPTEEQICEAIGLKPTARNCHKVEGWLVASYDSVACESLQSEVDDGEGNTTTLEAQVADETDWLERMKRADEIEVVRNLIATELTEEQRTVLLDTLRGVTQAAIGAKFGKTHGWVDKVLRQTRELLKARLGY